MFFIELSDKGKSKQLIFEVKNTNLRNEIVAKIKYIMVSVLMNNFLLIIFLFLLLYTYCLLPINSILNFLLLINTKHLPNISLLFNNKTFEYSYLPYFTIENESKQPCGRSFIE